MHLNIYHISEVTCFWDLCVKIAAIFFQFYFDDVFLDSLQIPHWVIYAYLMVNSVLVQVQSEIQAVIGVVFKEAICSFLPMVYKNRQQYNNAKKDLAQ